ncbi:MAG TPA: sulfotransferase domain-containing protein [Allocoleopsis sp.]
MLLFSCGMVRSGSTVQYQIAVELVESHNLGMTIGWISNPNSEILEVLQSVTKRRDKYLILKCHDYTTAAGQLVELGAAKAVYIYRDLRDVAVSLGHKFFESVDAALASGLLERSLANYYGWTSTRKLMISRYESMMDDLKQEVTDVASYLKVNCSEAKISKIAEKFSIGAQKQRIEAFNYSKHGIAGSGGDAYDPVSQLHNHHIQSGEWGQWKEALTPEQIEWIEHRAFSWLVDRGYPLLTFQFKDSSKKSAEDYYKQGQRLHSKGKHVEAITACRQAIMLSPQKSNFHHFLGKLLFQTEDYAAAMLAYRHALALKPRSQSYRRGLGEALVKTNHLAEAIDVYEGAIQSRPSDPSLYAELAEIFVLQHRLEEANNCLKKAFTLSRK